MNSKGPKLAIVSILIAIILTSIGIALGYFVWNSTTNTDISFNVEGTVVQLNDGTDITGANLMPVASYTSGGKDIIKKDIKIRLKDETTDDVEVDFKLKINTIDSGLNHSSFKYNLVNASGTSMKSGNFATTKAGDTINLLTLSTSKGNLTTSLSSYTLYIYIDGASGDNPSSMQNQSFDMTFIVEGANSSRGTLNFVEQLDDGTTGDSGNGVYKITHNAIAGSNSATGSDIKATTDYRYYGANPSNYVCLDMEGQSTCPDRGLFRIIGSIYEENADTNLLKVTKANNLTDGATSSFSYDYTSSGSNSNIWSSVTSGTSNGATLMQLLNGIYLTRGTGNYYNNSTTATGINFGSTGLTDVAQSLINTGNNNLSRYYLGGYSSSSQKTEAIYLAERGNTTSSGSALYWDGKVGLMYASDYGYAAGSSCATGTNLADYSTSCYQRDWLHNTSDYHWTMSPSLTETNLVWVVYNLANVRVDRAFYSSYSVYPVFYLDKDVYVVSGTGSSMDPYILSK